MRLSAIRPITNSEVYIFGNVTIDQGVIIAPGVILQAAPESSIVIKAGACLGMGTIITASGGTIEIEAGVILGAGVLIVGQGRIGSNACIGSATTIFNSSIEPSTLILAGSLIGAPSIEMTATLESPIKEKVEDPWIEPATTEQNNQIVSPTSQHQPEPTKTPVVGQVYINQLLVTLFPERQSLNNS